MANQRPLKNNVLPKDNVDTNRFINNSHLLKNSSMTQANIKKNNSHNAHIKTLSP